MWTDVAAEMNRVSTSTSVAKFAVYDVAAVDTGDGWTADVNECAKVYGVSSVGVCVGNGYVVKND